MCVSVGYKAEGKVFSPKPLTCAKKGSQMEQIINSYYVDNAKKLHGMVDRILIKFGGLSGKDKDDFYSLANEVFVDVLKRYDGIQPFDGFLYACLSNKIMSEITKRNRYKRKADRMAVSIDTPVSEDNDYTIGDMLADGFNMEEEVFGEISAVTFRLERYLERLSQRQREVLELLSCCYEAMEIQKILHMTPKEYENALGNIRSYENIKLLL